MTNQDLVIADQDIFHQQTHDPLPLLHVEIFCR
jgi:hypothetical protein